MVVNNPSPRLLIATTNAHKLSEIRELFAQSHISILSPAEVPQLAHLEVEETGSTFAENAALKARAFGEQSGFLTAADDSGLEVTALNGEPGVTSARWFPGTDQDRMHALLERVQHSSDRSAQFTTVVCLYTPRSSIQFFTGTVRGKLAKEPRGASGFGYDPIFIPEGYTRTFSELGAEEKNRISHRARAFQKLLDYLVSARNF